MLKGVERWRDLVRAELARAGYPLPPEHVLALMYRESRGDPAAKSKKGALGLLQVMPITLREYNRQHKTDISLAQLASSPQTQVRVGLWVLGDYMRQVAAYLRQRIGTVALDDLIRITDIFYATGPGNAKPRLNRIKPVWEIIAATYPNWDRVKPAEEIWDRANEGGAAWDMQAINDWLDTTIEADRKQTIGGAAIALAILAIAWWYFGKEQKR